MRSIFSTLKNYHRNGKPIDFLATWQKTFDKASEKETILFQKMYVDEYCDWEVPQMSLQAEGLQGQYNIRIMAALIGDESPTPLRGSDGFKIWTGEIPRIGHKFFMSANRYRKLNEVLENSRLKETQKVKQIEKTLKHDITTAYLGCKDTLDFMLLSSLSNWGICTFTPGVNNPGGRTYKVNYNMSKDNKLVSNFEWTKENSDAGKLNIILQLKQIVTLFKAKGVEFGQLMMSPEMVAFIQQDINIRKTIYGTDKSSQIASNDELSSLFKKNGLPEIREIKRLNAIEKNGEREVLNPWNVNQIVFVPKGKFARVQPALEDSQLIEEDNVDYIDADKSIRVAKWRTGDSTNQKAGEWTQGSTRSIILIDEINSIVGVQVLGFTEKTNPNKDKLYMTKGVYDKASS
jgi:hypothetical protein